MPVVWIAFAAPVLALVAGGAFASMRGLEAWRTLRSAGAAIEDAAAELVRGAERVEERLASLESRPDLERSLARLRESTAVLRLQLAVVRDARAPLTRVRSAVRPR